jgi:undecaprenyl-diphosphatase
VTTLAVQLPLPGVDRSWYLSVNHFARSTPWLHEAFKLFAVYGVALFALLLLLSWWLARRENDVRRVAVTLWAPLGTLLAVGVNQYLGRWVGERRPYDTLHHVLVLVPRSTDFSFPSDHAVMAGAVAMGVLLAHRRLGLLTTLLALLMAFARVYVGAHFPYDVIAGLLVGALVTALGWLVVRVVLVPLTAALVRTPVSPLLVADRRAAEPRGERVRG